MWRAKAYGITDHIFRKTIRTDWALDFPKITWLIYSLQIPALELRHLLVFQPEYRKLVGFPNNIYTSYSPSFSIISFSTSHTGENFNTYSLQHDVYLLSVQRISKLVFLEGQQSSSSDRTSRWCSECYSGCTNNLSQTNHRLEDSCRESVHSEWLNKSDFLKSHSQPWCTAVVARFIHIRKISDFEVILNAFYNPFPSVGFKTIFYNISIQRVRSDNQELVFVNILTLSLVSKQKQKREKLMMVTVGDGTLRQHMVRLGYYRMAVFTQVGALTSCTGHITT